MRFPPNCVLWKTICGLNRPSTIPCASWHSVQFLAFTSQDFPKHISIQLSSVLDTPGKERAHQNQPHGVSQRIPIAFYSGSICSCARAAHGLSLQEMKGDSAAISPSGPSSIVSCVGLLCFFYRGYGSTIKYH